MRKVTVKIPRILIFIVAFLFVAIIGRLSFIALSNNIDGINLHEFASNRNTKSNVIYAKRGNIYDSRGNMLASTVNSYTIIAYLSPSRTTDPKKPQHVVDIEGTAKMLNEELGIDYDKAVKLLSKEGIYQTEFGTKGSGISESKKNEIEALNMPGIDFIQGQKRHYNMGQFASYIVGYAKTQEDGDIVGELGIESYYDKELSGTDGKTTYQTDAYGYTLPSAEVITEEALDGAEIYLTIDNRIQWFAETLTRNLAAEYDMDWMVFSVMDAKTGAIVASSTYPNFNPNDLSTLSIYTNPLVSYEYEPGSVMKVFSWATSINEGKYDGTKTFKSGCREIADAKICDFNDYGFGEINFDTGFAYSSNVGATYIGESVGNATLTDYYKKLGFSKKTGIELANEVSGKVNIKYKTDLATAAFGQGITVTPIQMLQALSSITNDGTVLKPYVVDKIVDGNGETIYDGKRTEVAKVFSKETTDYMQKLMHNVVYEGLESNKMYRPTLTNMMGKTGTAQIASPHGGYLKGGYDYVRSFAGIFPEDDPKYIVYVAAKQLSSSSARPIAEQLTKAVDDIVSNLGIENSAEEIASKVIKLDNYISKDMNSTVEDLQNKKLKVYKLGTGSYVINQYPLKGGEALEGSKVFLVSNKHDYVMEDLTGWSLSEVMTYVNLLGIDIKTNGYGYVTNQSIPVGTAISNDQVLEVTLSK